MKSEISVITVTYNSSKLIGKFLTSIQNYGQQIKEVIIVENNSPDKHITKRECGKYRDRINLTFIDSDNVGFGRSCNFGASKSISDYFLFINPDTELQKNSIKTLLEHLKINRAEMIGGLSLNYHGEKHGSAVRLPNLLIGLLEFTNLGKLFNTKVGHNLFYYEDISILKSKVDLNVGAVSGAYLLITKKAFQKLKGFDENIFMYLEDVDLGKRAHELEMKVIFCPHSSIYHIGGASSDNKYRISHQAWFHSRKYYFKKHFNFLANLIIQPIYSVEEYLLKRIKSI